MTAASSPPGSDTEAIVSALLTLERNEQDRWVKMQASRDARALLESLPIAHLADVITPLWVRENGAYQYRCRRNRSVAGLLLAVALVFSIMPAFVSLTNIMLFYTTAAGFLFQIVAIMAGFSSTTSLLQDALLRLIHQRPGVRFVPLLVDALEVSTSKYGPFPQQRTRDLLTRLLPLWCEQDSQPLSAARQRILLKEVKAVTRGSGALLRRLRERRRAMTLADADFALAALAALRHCQNGTEQDTFTHQVLTRLPRPASVDDPRHEIHSAAQVLLTRRGK